MSLCLIFQTKSSSGECGQLGQVDGRFKNEFKVDMHWIWSYVIDGRHVLHWPVGWSASQ